MNGSNEVTIERLASGQVAVRSTSGDDEVELIFSADLASRVGAYITKFAGANEPAQKVSVKS